MKIVEWIMHTGYHALQWYALYVLIAGCVFGAWLWHTVWHHHDDIGHHDLPHHRAD